MTLYLPYNLPWGQTTQCYIFGHNETHTALDLDYGSIINHHESANARVIGVNNDMYYRVRGFSMCESQCLKTMQHTYMHAYVRTCMHASLHTGMHAYACTHTQHAKVHITTFKATKDIAAGQEIFIRYGNAKWFEGKNVPYADVNYASTMWRPDLRPLRCRQSVDKTTGADGRHSFAVRESVPSGTVLEISLCLEVSVTVVDQFPFLWDFVLTGETENGIILVYWLPTDFCLLACTYRLCFLQIKTEQILENLLERFCISFIHSLYPNAQTRNRLYDLGVGLVSFVCLKWSMSICISQTSIRSRTHALQQCSHP